MPDVYDIDYDQAAIDLLSPDKRTDENIAILQAFMKSTQWSRDLVLGTIKQGSTAPVFAGGPYAIYDQVTYNKAVYESLKDGNTDLPTVADSWRLISANFIGLDERLKYNAQKIVLEWALNKEFDGVFRQPATAMNSDIYIEKIAPVLMGFRIGEDSEAAPISSIGADTSSDSIGGNYPFVQVNNFNIYFLNTLYVLTNEKAIRNFVDRYIPAGLKYIITPY